jgi:hypothetical protein
VGYFVVIWMWPALPLVDINGSKHGVHSGYTLGLGIEGNVSKRNLGVVLVSQRGMPTVISVVVRLVFELELRFGDVRSMLECRVQTSV